MSGDQVGNNGKQFADYPMLGFTEDRVTLTTNQFDYSDAPFTGGFQYVQVVSMRKTQLYDCSVPVVPIKVFSGNQTKDPTAPARSRSCPRSRSAVPPPTQYMTSLDFNGSTGKLILWRLKAVDGVLKLTKVSLGRGRDGLSPRGGGSAGTPPASTKWDTGDLRLTSSFWTARSDGSTRPPRSEGTSVAAPWNPWSAGGRSTRPRLLANSDVTRNGRVGASGRDARVALDRDRRRRQALGELRASGRERMPRRLRGCGPAGCHRSASVLIHAGFGRYEYGAGVDRWGDYTAISRDPLDPSTMAAYGPYPIDDGVGGTATELWQQVIATLTDV